MTAALLRTALALAHARGFAAAYATVAGPCEGFLEAKKSRFIARCEPVSSRAEALEFVARCAALESKKVRHHCWAAVAGGEEHFSDDGEPHGTAGQPILAAIGGSGYADVAVCVSRYFGGTKLGAGGLIRAYGGAARSALLAATPREVVAQATLRVRVPQRLIGRLHATVGRLGGAVAAQENDGAAVRAELRVDAESAAALRAAIDDATSGGASWGEG